MADNGEVVLFLLSVYIDIDFFGFIVGFHHGPGVKGGVLQKHTGSSKSKRWVLMVVLDCVISHGLISMPWVCGSFLLNRFPTSRLTSKVLPAPPSPGEL